MLNKRITILFWVTAFIYVASLSLTTYPYQFAVKALPIFILVLTCFSTLTGKHRVMMCLALQASLIGDVFLAIPFEMSFQYGLSAFLIAHIFYASYFFTIKNSSTNIASRLISIAVIVVFSLIAATFILPHTSALLAPVSIYLMVISIMAIIVFYRNLDTQIKVGVISFLISDTLLATNLFVQQFPMASYLVMITYYFAQYYIVRGVLTMQLKEHQS